MTPDQLAAITGLVAGLEASIVHLAGLLARSSGLSKSEIAQSYRATAAALPADVANRELVVLVLTQIAAGIESSAAGAPPPPDLSGVLH